MKVDRPHVFVTEWRINRRIAFCRVARFRNLYISFPYWPAGEFGQYRRTGLVVAVVLFLLQPHYLDAGNWNQILGPNRNGQAEGERLANNWKDSGPKQLWAYDVGKGYAGPVVVNGKVVIFHRIGDLERVEQVDLNSGKPIWKQDFDAYYRGGINPDTGPRCVPVVANDRIFVFGAAGVAHALEFRTGKPIWTRDLYGDYKGREGYFGAGSTPLVTGDLILFNVGGKQAGLVALNSATGKTVWKKTNEQASYSSPTLFEHQGRSDALFVTRMNAVLVDPSNGDTIFTLPFGKRGPTVNAATPLVAGNRIFLTASYGVGAQVLQVDAGKHKTVWKNDSSLSSQYNTPVIQKDHLFGIHGREDIGQAEFHCVSLESGKVRWRKAGFGVAHTILADKKLVVLTIDGQLVLLKASVEESTELARSKFSRSETRALPALSDGRLLARDGNRLYCLDLR